MEKTGVIVKGMSMPATCEDCLFLNSKHNCNVVNKYIPYFFMKRLEECPLEETIYEDDE